MARNFVQLVDDLAYAKTFYPTSRITRFINFLASRIYLRIYQNRKEESNRLVKFWKYDVPLTIAKHYRIILFCAFIFILFYVLGFFSAKYDENFTREVMGDNYINMTERNIENGNPFDVYQSGNSFLTWLGIMVHNVMVSMFAFVKGIVLGFLSLSDLIHNSMMVGVFHYMFASKGLGVDFLFVVMIHGLLELTALVIACAAGVIMGISYLFPGTISRLEAFKIGVKDGVKIIIGLVPIFAMAAFFESFVTGLYKMPLLLNIFILLLSASFIAWYFIIYPIKLKKRFSREILAAHV
jgi:uncharacterized membrane protein SpoIIM required for sporulation